MASSWPSASSYLASSSIALGASLLERQALILEAQPSLKVRGRLLFIVPLLS